MDIITLREAKINDIEILRQFEQEIVRYERPYDPNLKDEPIQYYNIENLIKSEDSQVLVAQVNNEIVGSGYALVKQNKPYKKPIKYGYLGFMYVMPDYRGKGINGKLIDGLIDWSKNKGLQEVQLDVYFENTNALKAYQKKGFQPSLLNMSLNI